MDARTEGFQFLSHRHSMLRTLGQTVGQNLFTGQLGIISSVTVCSAQCMIPIGLRFHMGEPNLQFSCPVHPFFTFCFPYLIVRNANISGIPTLFHTIAKGRH